jgi:hypothetical protein
MTHGEIDCHVPGRCLVVRCGVRVEYAGGGDAAQREPNGIAGAETSVGSAHG